MPRATLRRPEGPRLTMTGQVRRRALPLVDDLAGAERYIMTSHAIERAEERGIGIMEIYSAVADPQSVTPGDGDKRNYFRGDLRITVDEGTKTIITVIDIFEMERASPRVPLIPEIGRTERMAARTKSTTATVSANQQALDEAWVLAAHKEQEYRLILVTPDLAGKLLERNTHNRPIRPKDVAEWQQRFVAGEVGTTHQGIAVDTKGILQDGQHRCAAIFHSGVSVRMWVAVGMPPENFALIDGGRNRNYADVLALSGETDVTVLGATVRLVHLFESREYSVWNSSKITNAQVMDVFMADPIGFRDAIRQGRIIGGKNGIPMTKTAASAGFYLISKVNNPVTVEEFFDGLVTGAGLMGGDIRLVLRRNLNNAAKEKVRATGAVHLALLIKTWNAWAEGSDLRVLTFRRDERMPRVTKLEK